jgi:hypothetical protein
MALSKEDKGDVKHAMGKALANKVSKVTRDRYITMPSGGTGRVKKAGEHVASHSEIMKSGGYSKYNSKHR